MNKNKIKILYVNPQPGYSRNEIIRKGLIENNVELIECNNYGRKARTYPFLLIKYLVKLIQNRDSDFVYVGFYGQPLIPFIRFFTKKKIVFDAFISSYDTMVFDRKKYKQNSFLAKLLYKIDFWALKYSDFILTDTTEDKFFFEKNFDVLNKKIIPIFIGVDLDFFNPEQKNRKINSGKKFIVFFYGSFQPLQGVDKIISAAKFIPKSENIEFWIAGAGQTRKDIEEEAKHISIVKMLPQIPFSDVKNYINSSDICLGIFGDSEKAHRVIPNKVFECCACGKATISMDSKGIRELFNKNNLILIKDDEKLSEEMAKKIIYYKNHKQELAKIGKNARNLILNKASSIVLGKQIIEELCKNK